MTTKKIDALETKLKELKAILSEEKRKADVRKKILTGVAYLKALDEGKFTQEQFRALTNKYIRNKSDREFLELEPLPEHLTEATSEPVNDNNNYQEQPQEHQHSYQ